MIEKKVLMKEITKKAENNGFQTLSEVLDMIALTGKYVTPNELFGYMKAYDQQFIWNDPKAEYMKGLYIYLADKLIEEK